MSARPSFLAELKRRNVLRAGALYIGAAWALAQGIAQLSPAVGLSDATTRWFLLAAAIGCPFWLAFAWFYEWTPQGFRRESEVAADASITRSTGRTLDKWIIAVLAAAVVLLLTDRFALRRDAPSPAAAGIPDKSIAVLPLNNDSGDKDQQYFSDGLSEDLINALAQFSGLKVIGRNSAFQFRDTKDDSATIGRKLGVAHLLEGSVRHDGANVRISATLVNAADGSTLWSRHYDRPYQDLFALQDEITQAVAGALKARLLPAEGAVTQSDRPPGGDLDAYTAYLQGRSFYARNTPADQHKAIEQFKAATRLDPHYAFAWAWLARAHASLAQEFLEGAAAQQAYADARNAVATTLRLDPELAVGHIASSQLLMNADFNWAGSEAEARRALQLAPNDGTAHSWAATTQATLGRPDQAVELVRAALATDPLNANWHYWHSTYLSALDRLDEAEAAVRTAIDLQPRAATYHHQLAIIAVQRGDAPAALAAAQAEPPGIWQDIALALARSIGPDRAAADVALQHLIDTAATLAPLQIAEVYALRRDADRAFEWLDRAWSARDPGVAGPLFDPFLLRYRDDPRFAAFCRKVGLPTTTTAKAMP